MTPMPHLTPDPFRLSGINIRRLDSVTRTKRHKVTADDIVNDDVFHYSIPNIQEFNDGRLELGSSIDSDKWQIDTTSVLISKLNPRKSTVAIADPHPDRTVCSTEFLVLAADSHNDVKYLFYVLKSNCVTNFLDSRVESATKSHQRVEPITIEAMGVPWPISDERAKIADYLDAETDQIDASIDAQRRLIDLLQERRVGVIGDLVTHGIGKHDLVKTPELFWSQESPRDWDLTPLSGLVRTRFSGMWGTDQGEDEINVPCVRVADFDRERRVVSSDVPTIRSIPRSSWISKGLRTDDLLLERSGGTAKNPVGTVVRYSGSSGAICSNFIEVIRLREGQDPQYWNYALRFAYENGFTFKFVNQTTGIQNLDANGFYSAKFAVPPLTEQRQIVNALDAVTAKLDTLIVRSERLIELLQERRSAVITAAVTGQIDVTRSEEAA